MLTRWVADSEVCSPGGSPSDLHDLWSPPTLSDDSRDRSWIYPTYVGRESITMDHGMHDTMMSLLLILAILVLGLYFTLILVYNKSRVSLYATSLTPISTTRVHVI